MDMEKISGLKALIWDFDGTLYRQIPALWENIRDTEIQVIREHTGWSEEKAKEEFGKIHNVITPSGTKATSMLSHISNAQASIETSKLTDYAAYLKKDDRLTKLFADLSGFTHYMLVNGSQESVARGLSFLGVTPSIFTEIVTSETVGETKPSTKGFAYILQKTGLPPASHMMIGDREAVDLAPAKALGIRTCLVWSDQKSSIADITLSSVYDLSGVLG